MMRVETSNYTYHGFVSQRLISSFLMLKFKGIEIFLVPIKLVQVLMIKKNIKT